MTNKMLSLMTLLCVLGLEYLLMNFPSSFNPVELFISTDTNIAIARAFLLVAAVGISFWPVLHNTHLRKGLIGFGAALISLGAAGLFMLSGFYSDYLKPLDMLLMVELGVIFSVAALTAMPVSRPIASKQAALKVKPAAKKRSPQYVS